MLPIADANGVAINLGRSINLIDGISGVSAGGVPLVPVDTNRRLHRIDLQCAAVNYTGGTLLATKHLTGAGNDALVVTLAVNAFQVPTTVSPTTAGNGYNVGDTFSVTDATGAGAMFTVATLTGGAGSGVATATYNANSATASPIDPGLLLGIVKVSVSSIPMRDVTARFLLMIAQANGDLPALGELPIYFTEEWLRVIGPNDALSWDLFGQGTFVINPFVNAGYLLPAITGNYEFDGRRNIITVNGVDQPNLEPITYHAYNVNVAAGVTPVTTIPKEFPIRRIWLLGSTPGNISYLQLIQDGNNVLEGTVANINNMYKRAGFQLGQANYANQTQTAQKTLGLNPLNYFDTAFISDVDERFTKALKVVKSLSFRITSLIPQSISIIVEAMPGSYSTV